MNTARTTFLVAAFALSIGGCKRESKLITLPPAGSGSTGPRTVKVRTVEQTTDRQAIVASGTAAPAAETKIMSLVPGLITKIACEEGNVVKRGQVIAVIDQRSFKLGLRQAEAALEGAKVAVAATTREKQRFERLLEHDATARAQVEQILDKYNGAQAQLKAAQVALEMAQKSLADTMLRAPYDGVVVQKFASMGDYATTMPPTVILTMMDIRQLRIEVSLPEPELPRIAVGASARVTFPSLARTEQATIARIAKTVNSLTRSFEVVIELQNEKLELKPGLFAEVSIDASAPRRRLLIPSDALMDEGAGIYAVLVLDGTHAKRREVRVATAAGGKSEVISGLTGDERVIVNPGGLLDGDAVKLDPNSSDSTSSPTAPHVSAEARR